MVPWRFCSTGEIKKEPQSEETVAFLELRHEKKVFVIK